jgi:hypothetical protein
MGPPSDAAFTSETRQRDAQVREFAVIPIIFHSSDSRKILFGDCNLEKPKSPFHITEQIIGIRYKVPFPAFLHPSCDINTRQNQTHDTFPYPEHQKRLQELPRDRFPSRAEFSSIEPSLGCCQVAKREPSAGETEEIGAGVRLAEAAPHRNAAKRSKASRKERIMMKGQERRAQNIPRC